MPELRHGNPLELLCKFWSALPPCRPVARSFPVAVIRNTYCIHRQILGCRARNQPAQPPAGGRLPPFDHKTGEGHVPFHGGDYHDARYKKRNQVVPLIVEALGGIGRRGARCLRFLARTCGTTSLVTRQVLVKKACSASTSLKGGCSEISNFEIQSRVISSHEMAV